MTFLEQFFSETIRPSDIKFVWSVNRFKPTDWEAVTDEAFKIGVGQKINSGELVGEAAGEEIGKLIAKHTHKCWEYSLFRRSPAQEKIVKMVLKMGLEERKEFLKNSRNWKTLQQVVKFETKKTRIFSSLSNAQKWANRKGLEINVYSLWESEKKRRAQMAKTLLETNKGKKKEYGN